MSACKTQCHCRMQRVVACGMNQKAGKVSERGTGMTDDTAGMKATTGLGSMTGTARMTGTTIYWRVRI